MHDRSGRRSRRTAAALALALPCAAVAQERPASPAPKTDPAGDSDVVVYGKRAASVQTDVAPIALFDSAAIAATGATTLPEFLRTIRAVTQSADGLDPIFLLNAQRVSGYQDIATLPPEAIEKIEVLPEPVALKYGYPPTRRVINFITKRHFHQNEVRASLGTTTRGGNTTATADVGLTRLQNDARFTLNLDYGHAESLLVSERHIVPDPEVPFDAIGNVTAAGGGEIDPALSAAAGQPVTVAPVPATAADRSSLAAYAAGANRLRTFADLDRTLQPENDTFKVDTVFAGRIGSATAGTVSLSAEQSRDASLGGAAAATLLVPAGNPYSPFAGPVLLDRALVEAPSLRQTQTTTTLHAGALLRGAVAGWKWDATAAIDQKRVAGFNESGIDLARANAAIAAGADPFMSLDPAVLTTRLADRAAQRTRTAGGKLVVSNTPVRVPAGLVSVTASGEVERARTDTVTRGVDALTLHLGRTRIEGSLALDLPLASKKAGFLPWLGELSVNGSVNARHVGGFGALTDTTAGVTWAPIKGIQFIGQLKRSATAPAFEALGAPQVSAPYGSVFDYTTGSTAIVSILQGGNPNLAAEHRSVRSLGLNLKPLAKEEVRLSATYQETTIRNQTGTVYATTAATELLLPDLFTRDAAGQLTSVAFRPINFHREQQRDLVMTLSASGVIGKGPPKTRLNYYGGIGPTIKFADRLQLTAGAPALDILSGDTVTGSGTSRAFGYCYGGVNYRGNGLNFDCWYQGPTRVSSAVPAADLHFSAIMYVGVSAFVSVHQFVRQPWTNRLQLTVKVENAMDDHQAVRDGYGRVPNRFQPDYLNPAGRRITLSLRKLL